MTLLHYAVKAGANGVGDSNSALRTVRFLVEGYNADISLRCNWNDFHAIHYAVFFDVAQILDYLLNISECEFIDDICRDFDGGTPLHIAASNGCLETAKVLLAHGANVLLKDSLGRTPLDCVHPDNSIYDKFFDYAKGTTAELKRLLENATLACIPDEGIGVDNQEPISGKLVLQALGINLGDKVIINNSKVGTLRYCGATQFASSIWAGVELDEPGGKNDGTVGGITYFRCAPNHGIFAPITKIAKFDERYMRFFKHVNYPGVDVSHVTSKVETGLSALKSKTLHALEVSIGNRIQLIDKRIGIVRFIGETKFAPGIWYGIEFNKAIGKNDGSVNDVRYFSCKPKHGIFSPVTKIYKILKDGRNVFDSDDNCSELSFALSRCSTDTSASKSHLSPRRHKPRMSWSKSSQLNLHHNPSKQNTWLTVGVNVFVNNSIGVLRYIGPVDFADGTWLGIELRTPSGKNDGSVKGKRYFQCKSKHGLLVRPKKVSVRGINGAKLLPDEP